MSTLYEDLIEDCKAHGFENPGLKNVIHLVAFHPSIRMLCNYRMQRRIMGSNPFSRLLKRYLWFRNCRKSACHISFDALIEPGVRIPHATGIVIGPEVIVKGGAVIFQNVTLAMIDDMPGTSPTIEEGATIFTGAVVVGKITVGKNAVVGANSVVKENVPEGAVVAGAPARVIKTAKVA